MMSDEDTDIQDQRTGDETETEQQPGDLPTAVNALATSVNEYISLAERHIEELKDEIKNSTTKTESLIEVLNKNGIATSESADKLDSIKQNLESLISNKNNEQVTNDTLRAELASALSEINQINTIVTQKYKDFDGKRRRLISDPIAPVSGPTSLNAASNGPTSLNAASTGLTSSTDASNGLTSSTAANEVTRMYSYTAKELFEQYNALQETNENFSMAYKNINKILYNKGLNQVIVQNEFIKTVIVYLFTTKNLAPLFTTEYTANAPELSDYTIPQPETTEMQNKICSVMDEVDFKPITNSKLSEWCNKAFFNVTGNRRKLGESASGGMRTRKYKQRAGKGRSKKNKRLQRKVYSTKRKQTKHRRKTKHIHRRRQPPRR